MSELSQYSDEQCQFLSAIARHGGKLAPTDYLDIVKGMGYTKKPECVWKYDENHDMYETSCGFARCLIDGTLEENNYIYCPCCGGQIKG